MDQTTKEIRDYYNANVKEEWSRIAGRPEFLITCRYLDRLYSPWRFGSGYRRRSWQILPLSV